MINGNYVIANGRKGNGRQAKSVKYDLMIAVAGGSTFLRAYQIF